MKLAAELAHYPAARPLNADQVVEYHAARLLLLLHVCGSKGQIHGLTKVAKLDFFVRYPAFFERAAKELDMSLVAGTPVNDSAMVRHHYGPWDPRYYQVLAYLEGRELITVEKEKSAFIFALTNAGVAAAKQLAAASAYSDIVLHMKNVKAAFGSKSGDWLKKLVYSVFDDEVAKLSRGQVIR
ncbi:hypothetical protein [Sorangium sp. So ce693]|uniref:hypothetical protein n=1 Tax=Sorangium sp. So ce693 TaxID=3133318 RepID=UPI003F610575